MQNYTEIFSDFSPEIYNNFNKLNEAIDFAMPLNKSHKHDLHYAVKDLSLLLTSERAEKNKPYWTNARLTSAYLRYFLPWNVLRIGQLINNLNFNFCKQENAQIADLGSGPLTFAIALFLTHKELRNKKIKIYAYDTSPHILDLGKKILSKYAELLGCEFVWELELVRANLKKIILPENLDFISACNVLNEMDLPRYDEEDVLDIHKLFIQIQTKIKDKGNILFVEPGTRLGGKWIIFLRRLALEAKLAIHAPCPHYNDCPMDFQNSKMWCHFKKNVEKTPKWLDFISKKAELEKESLSLAYLYLEKTKPESKNPKQARIVSDFIKIPLANEKFYFAKYACSNDGLLLLSRLEKGSTLSLANYELTTEIDKKSKAKIAKKL